MTQTFTATTSDIKALRAEAGAAGDMAQVAMRDRALAGDDAAWTACEQAIREARAQRDDES